MQTLAAACHILWRYLDEIVGITPIQIAYWMPRNALRGENFWGNRTRQQRAEMKPCTGAADRTAAHGALPRPSIGHGPPGALSASIARRTGVVDELDAVRDLHFECLGRRGEIEPRFAKSNLGQITE